MSKESYRLHSLLRDGMRENRRGFGGCFNTRIARFLTKMTHVLMGRESRIGVQERSELERRRIREWQSSTSCGTAILTFSFAFSGWSWITPKQRSYFFCHSPGWFLWFWLLVSSVAFPAQSIAPLGLHCASVGNVDVFIDSNKYDRDAVDSPCFPCGEGKSYRKCGSAHISSASEGWFAIGVAAGAASFTGPLRIACIQCPAGWNECGRLRDRPIVPGRTCSTVLVDVVISTV